MPRLFTALEVPPDVRFALALSRGGLVGARWADPENYHITLRFIGDIDARLADEVVESLDEVSRPSVAISFEGLAWFGGDKPRAIVAKINPTAELSDLAADHERRFRRLGLPAETRNFTPHVTLARMRGGSPAAVADYLTSRGRLAAAPFVAERFVLMSARDGVGGGPYVVEAEFPLG